MAVVRKVRVKWRTVKKKSETAWRYSDERMISPRLVVRRRLHRFRPRRFTGPNRRRWWWWSVRRVPPGIRMAVVRKVRVKWRTVKKKSETAWRYSDERMISSSTIASDLSSDDDYTDSDRDGLLDRTGGGGGGGVEDGQEEERDGVAVLGREDDLAAAELSRQDEIRRLVDDRERLVVRRRLHRFRPKRFTGPNRRRWWWWDRGRQEGESEVEDGQEEERDGVAVLGREDDLAAVPLLVDDRERLVVRRRLHRFRPKRFTGPNRRRWWCLGTSERTMLRRCEVGRADEAIGTDCTYLCERG
jgi:hypothetical protein